LQRHKETHPRVGRPVFIGELLITLNLRLDASKTSREIQYDIASILCKTADWSFQKREQVETTEYVIAGVPDLFIGALVAGLKIN